jgi:TPR repeat protein
MYDKGYGVSQDYVQAYMWYNIASVNGLELAGKDRDGVAQLMTPGQIAAAQKLARDWMEEQP